MAEEQVVVSSPEASPAPSDHKRKLEELEPETQTEPVADPPEADSEEKPEEHEQENSVEAGADFPEAKRARIDEKADGLAGENGFKLDSNEKPVKEYAVEPNVVSAQREDTEPTSVEVQETIDDEQPAAEDHETADSQKVSGDGSEEENILESSKAETEKSPEKIPEQEVDDSALQAQPTYDDGQTTSRKMEVPNNKVGVLIGKAGDTIRFLQTNSGAKIQITRDAEADPNLTTRPVELIGTLSCIVKAEKLINAVIAEADAGGSPSLVARGLPSVQTAGPTEQIEIQVPNEKVGLIIGRGGDTIKGLQNRSGARIQLIPQHLPEGDGSKERTVRVTGDKRQIEMAREMIEEVMNQTVRPSPHSSTFNQQAYRSRGPSVQHQWGPRASHAAHSTPYDYHQRGPYPSQNQQYTHPMYGNYPPQQMAPRNNFASGWEQRAPSGMQGQPPRGGGYDYYGGQGARSFDHSVPSQVSNPMHGFGHSPASSMGPPPSQANYNYGQARDSEYGHPAPYSQAAHTQQSYGHGHGYEEPKYDNYAPTQHTYGGHGSSQPIYPQTSSQPGYAAEQQYSKPASYAMPSQGPPAHVPQRPTQPGPGDMPYHGAVPSAHSYGANVPQPQQQQQQYPYASSAPMQQTYPSYGSAPAADGYNQVPTATGPGYPVQGGQPVSSYAQPVQQAAAYGQMVYGQYPSSQQGYTEQPVSATPAYGYQGAQDQAYGSAAGATYSVPPSGQPAYAQSTPAQPGYDQSAAPSGGYAAVPTNAPASYGKTVSPQPGYPQYDSTQMYAAPQ
ncbi:far upstream element-binding protein 2 isoform X1 [Tripterygium wilfordii]|uniref:Far upstream element-binding protein 2 isoform X1 n=1 Tax=Tripterygium wilfordii TaxID=458696 RepID=A0A7J7BZN1_TRIWF|nr:far upstream element-binding protein 2-like isoform X2 [Tripterygium wilfordii]KAF5727077.1 far upstream element-binding protein 2 isoform X1 [Tripterygium wilfordii]